MKKRQNINSLIGLLKKQEKKKNRFDTKQKELEEKGEKIADRKRQERLKKKDRKKSMKTRKQAEAFNKFSNDGSFLEKFMKEQQPKNDKSESDDESNEESDNGDKVEKDIVEPQPEKKIKLEIN